ncbi:MAG: hypothetical protein IPL71_25010 [Anaerolineales bacterium]|uniref:hypothetical protein n=1 Tax=Candidatus Villigracilis proximus TaxID=3140683 RepID=UPI00313590A3|nr:hypothetical protein [Anaerolineales bacterium]
MKPQVHQVERRCVRPIFAIASGMVDVALRGRRGKFTDKIGAEVEEAVSTITDSDFEAVQGMTTTAQAAL